MRYGSRQESTPGPFTGPLQGSGVVTDDEVDVETGEVNGNGEDMHMTLESEVLSDEPSVTHLERLNIFWWSFASRAERLLRHTTP